MESTLEKHEWRRLIYSDRTGSPAEQAHFGFGIGSNWPGETLHCVLDFLWRPQGLWNRWCRCDLHKHVWGFAWYSNWLHSLPNRQFRRHICRHRCWDLSLEWCELEWFQFRIAQRNRPRPWNHGELQRPACGHLWERSMDETVIANLWVGSRVRDRRIFLWGFGCTGMDNHGFWWRRRGVRIRLWVFCWIFDCYTRLRRWMLHVWNHRRLWRWDGRPKL